VTTAQTGPSNTNFALHVHGTPFQIESLTDAKV
jgi:hypothetical protein